MTMLRLRRPALFLSAVLAMAACEDGEPLAFLNEPSEATAGTASATSSTRRTTTVERDVEAPEVFQVTETGLWDGRPSLGGVWVAHPDVKEPERVLIRNETNDSFVIGALFRRERDNPGPRLQVSSDAAEALGMLAGQPAQLNVTALRREEETVPAPEPETVEDDPATETAAPVITPAAATADATAAAEAEAPAPKKGFFASLFAPKETAPEAPQDATEAATLDAPAPVETASLDEPAQAPAPVAAPTSSLAKPYIQIGIFSVEQNAENAAISLRRDGVVPTVLEQTGSGKTFWRVVVGPMNTSSERAVILKKVKSLGYTDAYFVAK